MPLEHWGNPGCILCLVPSLREVLRVHWSYGGWRWDYPCAPRTRRHAKVPRPRSLENLLLLLAGILTHAPLYYQLPRWAEGLDPTFVHHVRLEHSSFPFVLHMAAIHPLVWLAATIVIFIRICWNFGWTVRR